jgi:hypothetical protein
MDTLFTPAYDGNVSTLSTYNLSALYSVLALGTLFDQNLEANCQESKIYRHWADKLFYLQWPRSPSAVDELEALILLFRVSWSSIENFYAMKFELVSLGIKLCEKVKKPRFLIDLTNLCVILDWST